MKPFNSILHFHLNVTFSAHAVNHGNGNPNTEVYHSLCSKRSLQLTKFLRNNVFGKAIFSASDMTNVNLC